MRERRFWFVDVFAEDRYAGNQLAVVLGAGDLDGATMQRIAREINFSETTFVLQRKAEAAGYPVRIFTPAAEVPFAGHPTLGTAWVIRKELAPGSTEIRLALRAGSIPVRFAPSGDGAELLWMRQRPPEFGPRATTEEIAHLVGLAPADLAPAHAPQQVSTGLPFWIVPVDSLDSIKRCRLDLPAYERLVAASDAKGVLVYAAEAQEPGNQLHARMFAPAYGVPEDPATGSANGCLAAYLVRHRVLGSPAIDVRVEQGYEIGRPSLLHLRARQTADTIEVDVGGRVIPVANGNWL